MLVAAFAAAAGLYYWLQLIYGPIDDPAPFVVFGLALFVFAIVRVFFIKRK